MSSNIITTLIKDAEKNIVYPYTIDKIVATKNETSDLETDLASIERHINGVLNGDVIVNHAQKADRLTNERKITLTGDASGAGRFNGSKDISIDVEVKDNSHNHTIANVKDLQKALDGKLSISHDHPQWKTFGVASVTNEGKTTLVKADGVSDTLHLKAGANIVLEANNNDKSVLIKAILKDIEAISSETLKGVKIQFDADRAGNEQYIPVVSYSDALEIGSKIDFHLLSSPKDFDARLLVNPSGNLHYTIDGTNTYKVYHAGNHGAGSGLDADLLDGKHASFFAAATHHHDDVYLKLVGGTLQNDVTFANNKGVLGFTTNGIKRTLARLDLNNKVQLGSTSAETIINSSKNPVTNVNGTTHTFYHTGNKPSYRHDILDLPSTFTPSYHTHPSAEISDASASNIANVIMKRDGSGNFHASKATLTSIQVTGDASFKGITVSGNSTFQSGISVSGVVSATTDVRVNGNSVYHTGNKPSKGDVGLGNVANYGISDSTNHDSSSTYASSKSVKLAYDQATTALNRANEAYNHASGAHSKAESANNSATNAYNHASGAHSKAEAAQNKANEAYNKASDAFNVGNHSHPFDNYGGWTIQANGVNGNKIGSNGTMNIKGAGSVSVGISGNTVTVTGATIPTSLPANGGNSDTVDGYHTWVGSQSSYNSIGKNNSTIYFIY